MTYLAIYSESAHKVEFEKKIKDGSKVKDEVKIAPGDENLADAPLIDYDRARYDAECRGRGGDWKVYCVDSPFDWDNLIQKEVNK
jgi:hypothetical protein